MDAIDEYKLMNAANDYGMNIRKGYPRVMDETDVYIRNAFEAGAKWAAANIQSAIPPIKNPKQMKIKVSHSSEPIEVDAIRIEIHDKEYMIQHTADGLKVMEITNSDILIRPNTANTIVIVTRTK